MKSIAVGLLLFVLAFGLGLLLKQNPGDFEHVEAVFRSPCDISSQSCSVNEATVQYTIHFEGKPSPLKPFKVVLDTQQVFTDAPVISFEMEGMDMGFNQYSLKRTQLTGVIRYQAEVVLPVCSLGRNDWLMVLNLQTKESRHRAMFRFAQGE